MKELRITLDDKVYRQLKRIKKTTHYNWRDFITVLAKVHQEKLDEIEKQLEDMAKEDRVQNGTTGR